MPTITFRLCDDDGDEAGQQKKNKSPPSTSNNESKTTTRKKKNSKDDSSPRQKPLFIKQEDTGEDDVVLVSETTRGNNGTGATSTTPVAITIAASHQNNSKKSAFMRRMEELTRNAAATRTSENLQQTTDSALPNPPPSKRKRNVQEKTEKSKKQRKKQSKESSKNPTVSLPQDEESFYMNCTDEELERWLKEKYRQKAERIREQLQLQMKEELALLRNKRNLAKQTKPAPKTPRTTTSPKQSQTSTSAASSSSYSINISTQRKTCPSCKSSCKAIFTSKSGCEHQYCEACVVVASFSSNGQDDTNSNSQQMTNKKSTPAAVSLASTCTKSTAMQSASTQGSTLSIPVPSSCPICHILDGQPNKPPPVQNVVAVKPKRKHSYVPEWIQSPLEQQELGLERMSPSTRNHMSPPPRNHMSPPPPVAEGLPLKSATSLIYPSTHPASSRTQNVDRSKQEIYTMDRKLQSEIERGEMLKYLLSQEKARKMNAPPPQETLRRMNALPQQNHKDDSLEQKKYRQYPPSYPYHPYYGKF